MFFVVQGIGVARWQTQRGERQFYPGIRTAKGCEKKPQTYLLSQRPAGCMDKQERCVHVQQKQSGISHVFGVSQRLQMA